MSDATERAAETMEQAQERLDEVTRTSMERVEVALAALQGAMEGLQEALEREHVGEDAGRAARQVREAYTGVVDEVRTVGQTPEMQQAGAAISSGATAVRERAGAMTERVSGRVSDTRDRVGERVSETRDRVSGRVTEVRENVRETVAETREAVRRTAADVGAKAGAVRETAGRAARAPGKILDDYKRGVSGYMSRAIAGIGMFVAAGALGIVVLVLLAIWLTVGLNQYLGDPLGTFVSAVIFALAAGLVFYLGRQRMMDASSRMERARQEVREDIEYVKQPIRREFGARRGV